MVRGVWVGLLAIGCGAGGEAELLEVERMDAQMSECRLENTICAHLVAPELLGEPLYLRAHLVQRVGGVMHAWEVAYVVAPDLHERTGYILVIPHVAHAGTHFLTVRLVAATSARSRAEAELQDAPERLADSIEHVMAEDFDASRAARRASSWFEAQSSRRGAAAAVHRAQQQLFDEAPELPLLRGHTELEYAGWAGPFELDGTAVDVGIIELVPYAGQAIDKMPLP